MISDCQKCININTEYCRTCVETSGGKPSNFKEHPGEEQESEEPKFYGCRNFGI